jgi:hypothetical protein
MIVVQCPFCKVTDGFHWINCATKSMSDETRRKMGIVVEKVRKLQ